MEKRIVTSTKQRLLRKLARLETVNDQLEAELTHVNMLLQSLGFDEGLASLKLAAHELIEEQILDLGY